MKFVQHVPNFVDSDAKRAEVSTAADVLALPWVTGWSEGLTDAQYCLSGRSLMVDGFRDGEPWWWVIGTFAEPVDWFPTWEKRRNSRAANP